MKTCSNFIGWETKIAKDRQKLKVLKLCQNKRGQMFVGMLIFETFFYYFNQLPAARIGFKNLASPQMFGSSYFVRALAMQLQITTSKFWEAYALPN